MRACFAILLFLLLAGGAAEGEDSELFGRTIVSVGLTSDGEVKRERIEPLVELQAGQPLTEAATGATIRNLYATGDFREILIEAVPVDGGAAVVIHLFRSFRVGPLRFDDGVSLSKEEMRRAVPFSEGSVFSREALEEGAEALKRRAAAEGYIQAEVFPEVTFDRVEFTARVVYRIEAGKPARVAKALFDGETAPFTPERLLAKARLDPGDRYRETRARRDAERMTEFLHDEARLQGMVELIAAQPTEDGRVMPVYRISVGPEIVFETRGVKEKKVRREVHGAIEGQGFSEDIILQYVEDRKRDLQRKGYYRADVDYSIMEAPGKTTVTITVEEGKKYAIEEIRITGNESVEEETLRDLLVTREKGLPWIRPGRLVDEILKEDVSTILGYYQTHGWVSAEVEEPKVTEGSEPDRLVVGITVLEGPRTVVASRNVVGAEHADADELEKLFQVKPGEPFNPNEVRYDVYALQNYYRDRGWREAAVDDEWTLSADKTSAEVVYRVEEGMRSFFGKTIVRGNSRTNTERILQLVTWDEGDAFSEMEVLTTQGKLTRTGVFQRVEMEPQPADPASQARNVEIEVREGRSRSLLYGVGYQYAPESDLNRSDPYLVFGATHNNLFGSMRSAGFELQLRQSAFEDLFKGRLFDKELGTGRGRAQISFRDPFLLGKDIPLTVFLFASREPIQEIDIERLGLVTEVSRYYGRYLRAALRYEYQRITPVNPEDLSDIEREFRRFDQPIEQSTIGPTAFYDRRDDIIDPHKGYYVSTSAKYAFPFLSADARYTKVSGQTAYFYPIGRSVLAASARGGGIFPYGPADLPVPIAERFFAGGPSTNRGFDNDFQGIPGATVDYNTRAALHEGEGEGSCDEEKYPELAAYDCDTGPRIVGGNGFFAFNAELRFPIFASVGGTLFYDASQVWGEFSDIEFSLEGEAGLRQGVGLELRYMSPIGPIRVGYGIPVQRRTVLFDVTTLDENGNTVFLRRGERTEEKKGGFYFSIGYPF